jgi:membrane-associated phospholipid phosphatase
MATFLKKNLHLLAVLSIAGQGLIYMLIGALVSIHRSTVPINSSIDDRIPFLSGFVISYAAWMVILYIAFIYLGLTNRSLYWRSIITYNIAVMISNFIFIVFPTYMPRPDITGSDIFSKLVLFIYNNDEPVNCFPSIHCLTTYLLIITMHRHKLFAVVPRLLISLFLWSIIASTIFIKQHALVDAIGGIALAEITYRLVYYYLDKQGKLPVSKPFSSGVSLHG